MSTTALALSAVAALTIATAVAVIYIGRYRVARASLDAIAHAVASASLSLDIPAAPSKLRTVAGNELVACIDALCGALALARSELAHRRPLLADDLPRVGQPSRRRTLARAAG